MEKAIFKANFKKFFLYFIAGFLVLFFIRLVYGYTTNDKEVGNYYNIQQTNANIPGQGQQSYNFDLSRKNYASEKKQSGGSSVTQKFDQKYEKVGSLSSSSQEFDKDEKNTRELIKTFKAIIQYEESSGLGGRRLINLGIGVNPDKFDDMIVEIKKIGKLESIQIHKTDKTNEYSDLNAQKISLEKTRDSLISYKSKGGRIEELINLENKISEIEDSIQKLGVKLGEFDTENEFCTIKFSLRETIKAVKANWFSVFAQRLKVAFEWTIKYYLLLSIISLVGAICTLVLIIILEKLKVLSTLLNLK